VTVDYYSDNHGNWGSDNCYPNGAPPETCSTAGSHITPIFNFVKKETWGYCQNGKEFLVPQGSNYTMVQDSFRGTAAQILDGTNNSTAQDYTLRPFTKTVDTGWFKRYPVHQWNPDLDLASNILRLSGMADLDSQQTDTYTLSLSYDYQRKPHERLLGLVTMNEQGQWINAADMNFGGTKKFVLGPYKSGYELGTYGVDPNTHTAWAVINYNGDFAVAANIAPMPGYRK